MQWWALIRFERSRYRRVSWCRRELGRRWCRPKRCICRFRGRGTCHLDRRWGLWSLNGWRDHYRLLLHHWGEMRPLYRNCQCIFRRGRSLWWRNRLCRCRHWLGRDQCWLLWNDWEWRREMLCRNLSVDVSGDDGMRKWMNLSRDERDLPEPEKNESVHYHKIFYPTQRPW